MRVKMNIDACSKTIAALEKQQRALDEPHRNAKMSADLLFKSLDNTNRTFRDDLRIGGGGFQPK